MNNDFMSTVTSLLSNPGALDAIKQIASSAGTTTPKPVAPPSPLFADLSEQPARNTSPDNSFNPVNALMPRGGGPQDKNVALLNALAPYMRVERAAKIESAIKAIRVIGMISSLK